MIQLHLGCGSRYIPGFKHIDLGDYPHLDYRHSVRKLPMFKNNSVDLIYASHVLEYFSRVSVKAVLVEWHRVLKKKGILRLAVPDFRALIEGYKLFGLESILGPLYGRMEMGSKVIYHKTAYDFKSLMLLLETCGFENVQPYDWKQTIHKDYDDWSQSYLPRFRESPNEPGYKDGLLISLNVECRKA